MLGEMLLGQLQVYQLPIRLVDFRPLVLVQLLPIQMRYYQLNFTQFVCGCRIYEKIHYVIVNITVAALLEVYGSAILLLLLNQFTLSECKLLHQSN